MTQPIRIGDLVLVLIVGAIASMLIVPLPTTLLDFLLTINLSFSILLLLVGLYLPNSNALLSFPSILLLSTLFRLGLNVASSRLILSQADAGRVIEAFGTFLIRGEVVVGLIIFAIVTVVNFIVIASGAARVSEVAARFTLDSLPGKQLAIDSDMRAGLLSAEEAKRRRDDLRRESQLYGSMDGSMKFVQGDAIAGIIIVFANIFGGMYMGLREGQSFAEAIQTYTVLTVGDGLVTQIPSLLTSICAGIVVTRVSSSENTTLSRDLGTQLFARPSILFLVSAVLVLVGLLPGLPKLPFLTVGLAGAIGATFLIRRSYERAVGSMTRNDLHVQAGTSSLSLSEDESDDPPCELRLDSGTLYKIYRQQPQRYRAWWIKFQRDFFDETGIRLPELVVTGDDALQTGGYSVHRKGISLTSGSIIADTQLIEMHPQMAQIFGLKVLREVFHPLSQQRVFWTHSTPALHSLLEAGNVRSFDFFGAISMGIAKAALRIPEEFVTTTDVYSALRQLEKKHPGLVEEGFGKEFVTVPKLAEIVHGLLREKQSVRDFRSITECVATYCSVRGVQIGDESNLDIDEIVGFVRVARRRYVTANILHTRRTLRVIEAGAEILEVFNGDQFDEDSPNFGFEPGLFEELEKSVNTSLKPIRDFGFSAVSILTDSKSRARIKRFLEQVGSSVSVVVHDEIDTGVETERIAVWSL